MAASDHSYLPEDQEWPTKFRNFTRMLRRARIIRAKDIRQHSYETFLDELSILAQQNSDQTQKLKDKYTKNIERYRAEQNEIQAEARKAESEVSVQRRRADRFDLGEVMLEAALVICSITLLTRKQLFWKLGLVMGAAGVLIGAAGFLVR
jgi:hypothetical protein